MEGRQNMGDREFDLQHPPQPLYEDLQGTYRFKRNDIVSFLLEGGEYDMNALAEMEFSDEDRAQFAQLIGYSLYGWGELDYVDDEAWDRAVEGEVLMMDGSKKEVP